MVNVGIPCTNAPISLGKVEAASWNLTGQPTMAAKCGGNLCLAKRCFALPVTDYLLAWLTFQRFKYRVAE